MVYNRYLQSLGRSCALISPQIKIPYRKVGIKVEWAGCGVEAVPDEA